jgi:UDP-3-O-[3-hydroxymyristoyl] N-acetylglucosamine deacetylase/3-hydroxyacyl-[acyl-carrier-protein] dehydratase
MYEKQHTIKYPVTIEGIGLHTGEYSRLTIHPAPENHGIKFKRVDLEGQPIIEALAENVVDVSRSTTIGKGHARVVTVEHVMAALVGLQIDNALIEIHGSEPPAIDGSALPYVELIQKAGTVTQNANREFYVIEEPIHYHEDSREIDIAALPFDDFRVTVMIDYNSPVLGIQHATLIKLEDFPTEIAPARSFCFLHEVLPLLKSGLIKGGSLDNSIVLVDRPLPQEEMEELSRIFNKPDIQISKRGVLNNTDLRLPNEPARHKLLDLIGDLGLVGAPIKAQILAARPGHKANVEFARLIHRKLQQKRIIKKYQSTASRDIVFDINAIHKILPHRYPFLLVDRITKFQEDYIEGIKNVTINEPFFVGHFEGNPIMPGVLQLEAMAQVGGVLLLNIIENPEDHWVYFVAIDKARFRRPVRPGDQLYFKLKLLSLKRGICKMSGKAYVDGELACEAEMVASLVKKERS